MTKLRFYFDENVEIEVVEQLVKRGIDAISVHDLDLFSDTDLHHLVRAAEMGRVLCTYDTDFLQLHAAGVEHAGIAWGARRKSTIGGWVRYLSALYDQSTAEAARGRVFYITFA